VNTGHHPDNIDHPMRRPERTAGSRRHPQAAGSGPLRSVAVKTRYGASVAGTEKEVLGGFLNHYRQTLMEICDGLSEEQLQRPMVPSGTSLLSIVKHLAYVERGWFQEHVANEAYDCPFDVNDPEAEFRIEDGETSEQILDLYRAACARSTQAFEAASLDDMVENPHRHADYNVR
jgi:uncharacterized damage-inducible protein DinB